MPEPVSEPTAEPTAAPAAAPSAGPTAATTAAPAAVPAARVVLFGRAGCHLCDAARALVVRVCAETGDAWVEVDVDDPAAPLTPSRRDDLGELVPVVEVDGVMRGYFRIDENRLRRALAADPRTP
ncbi:glutaredoxin family protein [Cellulomonas chitinilytica]|uniref:glutaredoxin family protein n=1 Tax=Cellulomonas chitinilytica TaxID=398759 RepID=UPI0027E482FD|nr:glutaredoxin family protein [Cellulomonas chitinilytica]